MDLTPLRCMGVPLEAVVYFWENGMDMGQGERGNLRRFEFCMTTLKHLTDIHFQ